MAIHELVLKVVITLTTTRNENQIRNALASLRPDIDAFLQAQADGDPQTTLVETAYRLKINLESGNQWVYPKMVVIVDSTREESVIQTALNNNFVPFLKPKIRALVVGDPQTAIDHWHAHWTDGPQDEVEP